MADITKPMALDESIHTTELTPRNIADVLASGLANIANNVKPDGSDISISVPGMTANNVNDGFSELKGTLDDKVNYHLITASDGYTSNASKTALRDYCDSLTSKIPIMYTLDAGSLGFGYMFKGSSNYALIIYYQYGNGTITQVAMTKYSGTWSDWFNI